MFRRLEPDYRVVCARPECGNACARFVTEKQLNSARVRKGHDADNRSNRNRPELINHTEKLCLSKCIKKTYLGLWLWLWLCLGLAFDLS